MQIFASLKYFFNAPKKIPFRFITIDWGFTLKYYFFSTAANLQFRFCKQNGVTRNFYSIARNFAN